MSIDRLWVILEQEQSWISMLPHNDFENLNNKNSAKQNARWNRTRESRETYVSYDKDNNSMEYTHNY